MLHLLLGVSALVAPTVAQCTREVLQEAANAYVASVQQGKVSIATVQNVNYTENFKPASIQGGLLAKPVKIALQRHLIDTTACSTFTEIVAHENEPPYVIGTQIHYSGGKADKIEALVTSKENGWLFDAKATYNWASKENRPVIPEGKRDTRETIKKIADAYLDKFSDSSIQIPIASPCERLEGKMHVAPNCIAGIPNTGAKGKSTMTNRRYVIDEAVGTVDVFLNFMALPDSHEFRVEEGKLKIVHTITVGGTISGAFGKGGKGAPGVGGGAPKAPGGPKGGAPGGFPGGPKGAAPGSIPGASPGPVPAAAPGAPPGGAPPAAPGAAPKSAPGLPGVPTGPLGS